MKKSLIIGITLRSVQSKTVSIVVIGAGNRANKYLEYAKINPDKVQLVGVVELNDIRRNKVAERFGLDASQCYSDYKTFFHNPVKSHV